MNYNDHETPRQKRERLLAEIVKLCGLERERVLRQQLDSFNELQVEVAHRLIMRAENGQAAYWRRRAEQAEQVVLGTTDPQTDSSGVN